MSSDNAITCVKKPKIVNHSKGDFSRGTIRLAILMHNSLVSVFERKCALFVNPKREIILVNERRNKK